jgi:glycosyltransferase involved in cell wall biosynthesis
VLTVLFATRNRESILTAVLESYRTLAPPPGGWKLVVVDNGSTDRTKDAVTAFQGRLPLTYLFEPTNGKNAALNTGIAEVSGDLVVLTDDDVFPRPDWLLQMRAAADAHPDFSVFGGAVVPRWEVPPAEWILAWVPLVSMYAVSNPSLVEGPTTPARVFGPNMAVRASVFGAGYRFDPAIGPREGPYAMGSETEFVMRLAKAGFQAWHCPGSVVEHFIREIQLQRSWVLGRAVRLGRGQQRLSESDESLRVRKWFGVPRWLFRALLRSMFGMARARSVGDAERRFRSHWERNYLLGRIIEARLVRREATRSPGMAGGHR